MTNFFEILPEEVITGIAKSLDMKTLCNLIMTSKEFKELCDTNDIWKLHYFMTIKDKWKITDNSVHIHRGHGDIIYLYEFNDGDDDTFEVKSRMPPSSIRIYNIENPMMWDFRTNVKYIRIYRGETPYIPDSRWHPTGTDGTIRSGCMNCQFNLIKNSGIVSVRDPDMHAHTWRQDIVNKWIKLNKDNGIPNLCQNPMHYDINTLEMPKSCRGFKNYKKVIIKKLLTKCKKDNVAYHHTKKKDKTLAEIERLKARIMHNEKLVIEQESYISDALEKAERIQNALDSY